MKVNFNTNQSNYAPNFGKLTIDKEAALRLKKIVRTIPDAEVKKSFLECFKNAAEALENSPLRCCLKLTQNSPTSCMRPLTIIVHDAEECFPKDTAFLSSGERKLFSQQNDRDTNFLKKAVEYVKSLTRDNEDLIKIFQEGKFEVVESGKKSNIIEI